MTDSERFMEIFHRNILTKYEIENEIVRSGFNTSFEELLKKGYIRPTGRSYQNHEFYAPNVQSWIKANYPVSRLEAIDLGANYRMPLRFEKWFVDYLRNELKWNQNQILLWWNSAFGRSFADAYMPKAITELNTRQKFINEIKKEKERFQNELATLRKEEPNYNKQSAEKYYSQSSSLTANNMISSIFHKEAIIKDAVTLKYFARFKPEFIKYTFEKSPHYIL